MNTKKSAPPKTYHESYSIPATATTSTRRETKQVPRVIAYLPDSVDSRFVGISLVQLSQPEKNDQCYTHAHTDRLIIMAPCTHPGTKKLSCPKGNKRPRSLRLLGLASCTSLLVMRQGGLVLASGRVRSKEKNEQKKRKKSAPLKTHHEIYSTPATASNSRRHVRKQAPCVSPYPLASIDPRFVEFGLVKLSQSVKTTKLTHTLTDTQTD